MAGAVGVRPTSTVSPASPEAAREQWEVAFSRFFNFPRRSPSALPTTLRPLPKGKIRSTGTWITAASPAVVVLLRPRAYSVPIMSVSVGGEIYEEHFVSNLHFSWPQVSCVSDCPIRGSRVVFMSYRDCSSQIQKFAVRFHACCAAEAFINSVKECSRDTMDIGHPGSDFMCENSSASEFIASNGLHNRLDEESSYEEPLATIVPEMPALTFHKEESKSPLQPSLVSNVETVFSGLPPSFTDMLTNCMMDSEKEQTTPAEETDFSSQNRGCLLDPPHHDAGAAQQSDAGAAQQSMFMDEANLKAQLAKYMTDSSFHDMLSKIERVIDELGGDLTL